MSMIRQIKRSMAREELAYKGYAHVAKPNTGDRKKGQFRNRSRLPIGSGSWFAAFWRNAKDLKNNRSGEEQKLQKIELLTKKAKYIIRMHKNGRTVDEIARITNQKPKAIRSLLKIEHLEEVG